MTTVRRLVAVMVVAGGLTACGTDDDGGGAADPEVTPAETSAEETSTSSPPPVDGDAVLIETRVTDARSHTTEVLDGSVVGESAFCPGGTAGGGSDGATITSTFTCAGGTLEVRYAPRQPSLVQSASWEVVRGTGDYDGLRGGGWMVAVFDSDDPDAGREIFTGTVSG
jgi:hypothetical protein